MKIAVSGKGGVGKSTLSAALALLLAADGRRVLALDADPDANLASALGISQAEQSSIRPIARQVDLIEERTEANLAAFGGVFKLNPHVADIADRYGYAHKGVSLLVMGGVTKGGGGCACPASTFLKALVNDLVLFKEDALLLDMEAGLEHLGRAVVSKVDCLLVVVEPGKRSLDSARDIVRLAQDIGLRRIAFVANKVSGPEEEAYIRNNLPTDGALWGVIPYAASLRLCDRDGLSVLDGADEPVLAAFSGIVTRIKETCP